MDGTTGIMGPMPEPTTVWEVDLIKGRLDERRGTLVLGPEALLFRPDAEAAATRGIPFAQIRQVKRLLASPVLLIRHTAAGAALETAYYFVEPPALTPPRDAPVKRFSSGKRKTRREAVSKLTGANRDLRSEIRGWRREIEEAVRSARGTGRGAG